MRQLTITTTGESESLELYEGTNKVTVLTVGTVEATVLDNGVEKTLPEDVAANGIVEGDVTFLVNGPGTLQLDVTTLSGGGAQISISVEKSHG